MTVIASKSLRFDALPARVSANPLRDLGAASSMRIVKLDSSQTRRTHLHPNSEEVIYVRSGHATVFVDGTPHPVGPGDVIHIPTGASHATIPDVGEEVELICFFPHPELADNYQETDLHVSTEDGT
jgi:quercetin dioxygenase-like cupin family protein